MQAKSQGFNKVVPCNRVRQSKEIVSVYMFEEKTHYVEVYERIPLMLLSCLAELLVCKGIPGHQDSAADIPET